MNRVLALGEDKVEHQTLNVDALDNIPDRVRVQIKELQEEIAELRLLLSGARSCAEFTSEAFYNLSQRAGRMEATLKEIVDRTNAVPGQGRINTLARYGLGKT